MKIARLTAILLTLLAGAAGWQPSLAVAQESAVQKETAQASPETPPQPAQPPATVLPPDVASTISDVVDKIDGAEKTLTAIKSVDTDLGRLRDDIDQVIAKTTRTADGLRPHLADIEEQINKLGAAPAKDAQPKPPPSPRSARASSPRKANSPAPSRPSRSPGGGRRRPSRSSPI